MPKAKPAARITDRTQHGGALVTGSLSVTIEGLPAARLADLHVCPEHVGGAVVEVGSVPVSSAMPAARKDDLVLCPGGPHQIVSGASRTSFGTNVHIGGLSLSMPGGPTQEAPGFDKPGGPGGGGAAVPPVTGSGGGVPIPSGEELRQIIRDVGNELVDHPKVTKPLEEDLDSERALRIVSGSQFLGNVQHFRKYRGDRPSGVHPMSSAATRRQYYLWGQTDAQSNEKQLLDSLNSRVAGVDRYKDIPGQMGRFSEGLASRGETEEVYDMRISQAFERFLRHGSFPKFVSKSKGTSGTSDLFARYLLLFNRETIRNPATSVYLPIMLRQISSNDMTWKEAFADFENKSTFGGRGRFPMSMIGAQAASVQPRVLTGSARSRQKQETAGNELDRREDALAKPWVDSVVGEAMATQGIKSFATPQEAKKFTHDVIMAEMEHAYGLDKTALPNRSKL